MEPLIIPEFAAKISRKTKLKEGVDFISSKYFRPKKNKITIKDALFGGNRRSRRGALAQLKRMQKTGDK